MRIYGPYAAHHPDGVFSGLPMISNSNVSLPEKLRIIADLEANLGLSGFKIQLRGDIDGSSRPLGTIKAVDSVLAAAQEMQRMVTLPDGAFVKALPEIPRY